MVVKSACCSCRGPASGSQHPLQAVHTIYSSISRGPTSSSGLCGNLHSHMRKPTHRHMHIHEIKNKNKSLKIKRRMTPMAK